MTIHSLLRLIAASSLLLMLGSVPSFAQDTAFTYQGRLYDGANAAEGSYDLRFAIYDSLAGPGQVGLNVTNLATAISNGLFTVTLDFGADVFDGNARWLEIEARTNGAATFTPLSPRQPVTPAPYAIAAANLTGTLPASQLTGALASAQLSGTYTNPVTFSHGANTFDGTFIGTFLGATFMGGSFSGHFFGDAAGLINLNASQLTTGTVPAAQLAGSAWLLGGNAGTTPGTQFLGTTDNQALELKVNGARAFSLRPGPESPDVIGGHPNNAVAAGIEGATIGGGGNTAGPNVVMGRFGTISGGVANLISTNAGDTTIGGGFNNHIEPFCGYATVGGGAHNRAAAVSSTASGGYGNEAVGQDSTVSGGFANVVRSAAGVLGGGSINLVDSNSFAGVISGGELNYLGTNSPYSVIGGGSSHDLGNGCGGSTIGGGQTNSIGDGSYYGTIAGGSVNFIGLGARGCTIGGGWYNVISDNSYDSVVAGGRENIIEKNAWAGTISGGSFNRISQDSPDSAIGGGYNNLIDSGSYSSLIAGGSANVIGASAHRNSIGGGTENWIGNEATENTIAGGYRNSITNNASDATISGGYNNCIRNNSHYTTISGGTGNDIGNNSSYSAIGGGSTQVVGTNSWYAAIGGGYHNTVGTNAYYGTIPGGANNFATNYAFAAGNQAKAFHTGAFVWGDSTIGNVVSTNANSVTMRAAGGYRLFSNAAANMGVFLGSGSGSWTSMSDRNAKENFSPVDPQEILAKVAALPMTAWNYRSQDPSIRHLGPMAQDFKAAFGLGESDTGITTIDADGVALAAIQALNQKLEQKETEIADLKNRLELLEQVLARQAPD